MRSISFSKSSGNRGVALVVTLLLLVITTTIVVAFLVRASFDYEASANYSASVQSEMLAASAGDHVVANFIAEIIDPTKSEVHVLSTSGNLTWFEPVDRKNTFPSMIPELATSYGNVRNNLVKQSLASTPFYSEAQPVASSEKSSSPSGQRPVSSERWDLPKLLLNASGNASGSFDDEHAPDWIYIKENGEPTVTASSSDGISRIVGRYAYNVYDVGGLLNLNVAGHSSSLKDDDAGAKGGAAFADLTKLPGGVGDKIDQIVNWRSPYIDWSTLGGTNPPITGPSLPILDYLRMGTNNGWMKNPAPDSVEGKGNQFFSRRDLVKYATTNGFEDSLPYLTHFSVDADAPTFSPDTEVLNLQTPIRSRAGKSSRILESDSATPLSSSDQGRINPARSDANTVIEAYKLPNGTRTTAPALPKRFPLSRLALVGTDPAERPKSGSTGDLTVKYFGLEKVDDFTWLYRDEEGGVNHIKTLDEVAAENREPNFFEILKSVIQVGSLVQFRTPIDTLTTVAGSGGLEPVANRLDEHILRIGAAIIDQADADPFPTRIRFNYDPQTGFGEIYGVEDLPYIHYLRVVGYGTASDENVHYFIAQPSLWNPHNPLRRAEDSGYWGSAGKFQIDTLKPFGNINVYAGEFVDANGSLHRNSDTTHQFRNEQTVLSFNWTPDSHTFRQPQALLTENGYPLDTSTTIANGFNAPVNSREYNLLQPLGSGAMVGFELGRNLFPMTNSSNNEGLNPDTIKYSGGPAQFRLKYQAPDGSYYTYDTLWFNPSAVKFNNRSGTFSTSGTFMSLFSGAPHPDAPYGSSDFRSEAAYLKSDPRSQRFIWASDTIGFTFGQDLGAMGRYMLSEGTGPGWYRGIFALSTDRFTRGTAGFDPGADSNRTWGYGSHPFGSSGSNESYMREDLGYLTINDKKRQGAQTTGLGGGKINDTGTGIFYKDHDGTFRRAMAGGVNPGGSGISAGNPPPLQYSNSNTASVDYPLPLQGQAMKNLNATSGEYGDIDQMYASRPIILNRPFRSVAELAYAFRDVPWKNIDFTFSESGDTGLLDVFTVYENEGQPRSATPLVAGKVNINTAPAPVLEALLSGTYKEIFVDSDQPNPNAAPLQDAAIDKLARRLVEYRDPNGSPDESPSGQNGPLRSLAELVGRVYSSGSGNYSDEARFVGLQPSDSSTLASSEATQEALGAAARALADSSSTRTWNLMIDLVVQPGKLPKNSGNLADFVVSAESRWWVFISIDRFTGKILARSVERVHE